MARNRYGWTKRAKELARKQKSEEKRKRRQNKAQDTPGEETAERTEEENQASEAINALQEGAPGPGIRGSSA